MLKLDISKVGIVRSLSSVLLVTTASRQGVPESLTDVREAQGGGDTSSEREVLVLGCGNGTNDQNS
jgi:hypothetical protein